MPTSQQIKAAAMFDRLANEVDTIPRDLMSVFQKLADHMGFHAFEAAVHEQLSDVGDVSKENSEAFVRKFVLKTLTKLGA